MNIHPIAPEAINIHATRVRVAANVAALSDLICHSAISIPGQNWHINPAGPRRTTVVQSLAGMKVAKLHAMAALIAHITQVIVASELTDHVPRRLKSTQVATGIPT